MKKVLIIGAAGIIGSKVVSKILMQSIYEVTLLELKNKNTNKQLKKYSKRINVIFGDASDEVLMAALVKDHDIIIHLGGVMPPLANYDDLSYQNNYSATENIVKCIKDNKNNNYLLFASCLSVYDKDENNKYGKTKILEEDLINNELRNYSIIRLSQVISTRCVNLNVYNTPVASEIELITDNDASDVFVKALQNLEKMKRKTFEVSGGENCRTTYLDYVRNICRINGLNFAYIKKRLFNRKNNFLKNIIIDNDLLKIYNYQSESLNDFYKELSSSVKKRRFINIILGRIYITLFKRNKKDEKNI